MGRITAEEIEPDGRLPRIEARDLFSNELLDATVERSAELVRVAQKMCAKLTLDGEGRSVAYAQAIADRYEALRNLRDTAAASRAELEIKREILGELEVWIGREDPECCAFAIQLAHEAIGLLELYQNGAEDESHRAKNGHLGGPGRWLMGAAASVPAFIVDRFGLG